MTHIAFNPCRAIGRGATGVGLDIDASSVTRLCIKAETYAFCGDLSMYRNTVEMIADRLEQMAGLAAELRASLEPPRVPPAVALVPETGAA